MNPIGETVGQSQHALSGRMLVILDEDAYRGWLEANPKTQWILCCDWTDRYDGLQTGQPPVEP